VLLGTASVKQTMKKKGSTVLTLSPVDLQKITTFINELVTDNNNANDLAFEIKKSNILHIDL
jgi:hypothetical protein